jgi:hypothetical protein
MTAPRTGHEWSMVRGPPAGFPAPIRMSTFRNQSADDDWAAAAAESTASATLSPRSQRRTRSSRAAAATDVRVFI